MANYIQEIELATGSSAYVQVVHNKPSLSFENRETNFSIWLTPDELRQMQAAITLALAEIENDNE